jgi:inner membrane protein
VRKGDLRLPTSFTHAFIPLALGHTITDRKLPLRFWFLAVFCSVLPDLDIIGLYLGISYGDFLGHRGFFHSLFFAFLLSSTVMILAFRKPPVFSKKWWLIWLFFFGVSSLHGVLDAFNNAGLGIALLSPFDTTRYFSPWRPLVLAPMEIRVLFTALGKEMLLSELYWIWLPLILALIIVRAYRKIKLRNYDKTIKAESQSVELAKNTFKRLFLALLVLLLISGLAFQFLWKLTTLLLIVLAACIVLPKPYRKWFWLSVAVIVLVLISWVFLPEDNEGWRPYTFDEEFAALQARYAIPDSQNAALIYNQLLENYNEDVFDANLSYGAQFRLRSGKTLLSEDESEVREWLPQHKTTVDELLKASEIKKCRFTLSQYSVTSKQRMKRLGAMRNWAFLLVAAANNNFREGRTDEALEKMTAALQMGKHEHQQGTMGDILVGINIEAMVINQLKNFIIDGYASEEHLRIIGKSLSDIKHDWYSDLPRILECGSLFAKSSLAHMFYQINQKGRIRLSRDPYAEWRADFEERVKTGLIDKNQVFDLWKLWVYPSYFQKKVIRSKTILNWFLIPSKPHKAAKIVDALYERYRPMSDPAFDWKKERKETYKGFDFNCPSPFRWLLVILEPPLYSFHNMYIRNIAEQRGTLLIVALRRYRNENGRWPVQLDDISSLVPAEIFIDPFNDDSFVYKLTHDGFTLYSKGENNIDEDGNSEWWSHRKGPDDWRFWPTSSRKTKKKNADSK